MLMCLELSFFRTKRKPCSFPPHCPEQAVTLTKHGTRWTELCVSQAVPAVLRVQRRSQARGTPAPHPLWHRRSGQEGSDPCLFR